MQITMDGTPEELATFKGFVNIGSSDKSKLDVTIYATRFNTNCDDYMRMELAEQITEALNKITAKYHDDERFTLRLRVEI